MIIEGSLKKNPNRPFCMWIQYPEKTWTQRVRITPCNDIDDTIKFDYANGRIFMRNYPNICIGWESGRGKESLEKVAVSAMKCFSNNWSGDNQGHSEVQRAALILVNSSKYFDFPKFIVTLATLRKILDFENFDKKNEIFDRHTRLFKVAMFKRM